MIFSLLFLSRNSGNSFGGNLNLTHMGGYSIGDKRLSITFTATTIVRRMNVDGIRVRTMVVVRSAARRAREGDTEHIHSLSPPPAIRWDGIFPIQNCIVPGDKQVQRVFRQIFGPRG